MWIKHHKYKRYEVCDNGNIRRVGALKMRKFRIDKDGYLRMNLVHNGKHITVKVHTMVAECFIDNPDNHNTVNHIDGVKSNNRTSNLEWLSNEDNVSDSYNRPHGKCHPIIYEGVSYRSKREAERITGISRFLF